MNQTQNSKAKELISQLQNDENPPDSIEKIVEETEKTYDIDQIITEEKDVTDEEFDKQQVEGAKKTRESKRRETSGDYIPLQNREKDFFEKSEKDRIYMSGVRANDDKIKKEFMEEEKRQNQKKARPRFMEEEEDDEFQKYEKKLINKVMKTSKYIDIFWFLKAFDKKTYNKVYLLIKTIYFIRRWET